MTDDGVAVRLEGVSKRFGPQVAVSGFDLEVPRGVIYGLLGPNGSGKTTTLRMIMGILHPDEGSVSLFGRAPDLSSRRRVGYLPEERGVYRKMKCLDLLVFLAEIRGVSEAVARRRGSEWLDRLGLGAWAGRRVEDLSKGMQQKVQFVATVIHEPELGVAQRHGNAVGIVRLEHDLERLEDAMATLGDGAEAAARRVTPWVNW